MNELINQMIEGDCISLLSSFAAKSFDLCLTDPPYNAKNIGPNERVYSLGQMQLPDKEYVKWCQAWFKQARRVSKTLVFTPGIANTHAYPQPDWIIAWHKPASVSFNRMGGYNAWEPIFVYGKPTKGARMGQDYLLCNTLNFSKGVEAGHPCPKPPALWQKLLEVFCPQGGVCIDPFMGSGTTAVVAQKTGRNWIGIDINPEYVEMTRERIRQKSLMIV